MRFVLKVSSFSPRSLLLTIYIHQSCHQSVTRSLASSPSTFRLFYDVCISPSLLLPSLNFLLVGGLVHGHGEPELEVLVEHLPSERHPLAEHLHGHEAERLSVHEEAVALDVRQRVRVGHGADPQLDVLAEPRARVWKKENG